MHLPAVVATALTVALLPGGASACTGRLSGALSGTFSCTVAVTPGNDGQYAVVVAPSGAIAGVARFLPATFEFAGRPSVGTFTLASFVGARASIQATGRGAYRAGLASGRRQGEVTLFVGTVEREARGGFTLSGNLTALLVPESGTGAPVVVDVTF
jgi:hypothetical protein